MRGDMATPRTAATTDAQSESATESSQSDEFACPECGKTFKSPAGLGAHRSRVHGVAGSSKSRRSKSVRATAAARSENGSSRRRAPRTQTAATNRSGAGNGGGIDHDALLRALFPKGVPPKREILDALTPWLAEADRLATLR